jgi:hypothetical protein
VVWVAVGTRRQQRWNEELRRDTIERREAVQRRAARLQERDSAGWAAGDRVKASKDMPELALPKLKPERHPGAAGTRAEGTVSDDWWADDFDGDEQLELETLSQVALYAEDPDDRLDAIEQLTTLDFDQILPVLMQVLSDPDPELRLFALNEIWLSMDEPPLDILGSVVSNDQDPEVRIEALRMVGESEDPRALQMVKAAANDSDEDVREEAADLIDLMSVEDDVSRMARQAQDSTS